LHAIVNSSMPLSVGHMKSADLRDQPRRNGPKQVLGIALVLAAVAVATLAVLAAHRSQIPTGASATSPATSPAPPPSLSAAVILETTTINAGGEIHGQVVVQNRTGHEIHVSGCRFIFQVLLTSSTYQPTVSWLQCLQAITIPEGRSTYPITVQASYWACGMLGASENMPACLPTGIPPLPPGDYEAKTFEDGGAVPLPAAVEVTVTP